MVLVALSQHWWYKLVIDGTWSFYGNTGWYFVVLGQLRGGTGKNLVVLTGRPYIT